MWGNLSSILQRNVSQMLAFSNCRTLFFVSSFYVITKIDAVFLMINGSTLGCAINHIFFSML